MEYLLNLYVKEYDCKGAVHKVRHALGGSPRRCDSLWQGEGGKEHVTSHLYIFLSHIWNMKFKMMFNFLLNFLL